MATYVVYGILGLLIAFPAGIFGVWVAEGITYLSQSDLPGKRLKRLYWAESADIAIVPIVISGVLIELAVLGLVNVGILQLGWLATFLWIIGLAIGGAIIGFFITYIYARLLYAIDPERRKKVQSIAESRAKSEKKTAQMLEKMRSKAALEKRKKGTPTTKVYRCGICGKTSPTGQYVVQEGMALCLEHAHVASNPTIYECPSCGYKFAEGWNEDYYKEHRCSNCGRHLDESSWG